MDTKTDPSHDREAARLARWGTLHPGELDKEIATMRRAGVRPSIVEACERTRDTMQIQRAAIYDRPGAL